MRITSEIIPLIEKAMGFKLYENQKKYLLSFGGLVGGRASGKTTVYCIQLALSDGPPLDMNHPEKFSDGWELPHHVRYARDHFRNEFMCIRQLLSDHGFRVRGVMRHGNRMEPKTVWRLQESDFEYVMSDKFPHLSVGQRDKIIEIAKRRFTLYNWDSAVGEFISFIEDEVTANETTRNG